MRATFASVVLAALLAALAATAQGAAAPSCGVRHAGPGAPRPASDAGALCLLRAYAAGCRPASYGLSLFGVDTIANDSFNLRRRGARCEVVVATSFEVVPNRKHLASGVCTSLARRAGDVVASGCAGQGLPQRISLTGAG